MLGRLGEVDSQILSDRLDEELNNFNNIIQEIEGNDDEIETLLLLTTHVGDILHARKNLIDAQKAAN